uniref:NACHT domain-containing protein n=1 Tax=Macrostomum lignano TaxID=282301 RepID=A0A1I8F5A2_9PLAT
MSPEWPSGRCLFAASPAMGKTSLLAQCVAMTTEQWCPPSEGVSVVFRYLGTSAMSYHIGDLLLSLLDQLQLLYGLPVDEEATESSILLCRYFPQYLNSLCQGPLAPGSGSALLLLLDSLDQLSPVMAPTRWPGYPESARPAFAWCSPRYRPPRSGSRPTASCWS